MKGGTMEYQNQIQGSCHCGNIQYRFLTNISEEKLSRRECQCSFCKMHGGVYTSDPEGELRYQIQDQKKVNHYNFGHQTADFYICQNCGGLMFALCEIEEKKYAVLNLRTTVSPKISIEEFAQSDFESEEPEGRLKRRQKNWIGKVIEE